MTLVCILAIFLAEVRADYAIRDIMDRITTPLVDFFHNISDSVLGIGDFIGSIGSLGEENKLLREQVQALQVSLTDLTEVELENQTLRDQLALKEDQNIETVSAEVIANEPVGGFKMVSINRGYDDGIREAMPVVVSEGLLVGKVTEVYSRSARVVLLLEPTLEVPARLQKSRADGIVKGQQLGQGLIMKLIPQEAEIARGNRVITSGIGQTYPKGLLIGFVQAINAEPNDIFQEADILPAVDFERVEEVLVITNYER